MRVIITLFLVLSTILLSCSNEEKCDINIPAEIVVDNRFDIYCYMSEIKEFNGDIYLAAEVNFAQLEFVEGDIYVDDLKSSPSEIFPVLKELKGSIYLKRSRLNFPDLMMVTGEIYLEYSHITASKLKEVESIKGKGYDLEVHFSPYLEQLKTFKIEGSLNNPTGIKNLRRVEDILEVHIDPPFKKPLEEKFESLEYVGNRLSLTYEDVVHDFAEINGLKGVKSIVLSSDYLAASDFCSFKDYFKENEISFKGIDYFRMTSFGIEEVDIYCK